MLPLGPQEAQFLTVIDKDAAGRLATRKLIPVRFTRSKRSDKPLSPPPPSLPPSPPPRRPRMQLFADLIDAFQHAEGPPPDRFWPFMAWALRGAFPAVGIALAVSLVVGASEMVAAALVGWLIDLAQSRGPEGLFADSWPWLLAACFFFLVFRPGFMGLGAALNALTLGPNLYPLVLSRLNRHTLGQCL